MPRRLTFDELMEILCVSVNFKFKENFVYSKNERTFYLFDEKENIYFIPDYESTLPEIVFSALTDLKKINDEQVAKIPNNQDITTSTVKNTIQYLSWVAPRKFEIMNTNYATFSDNKIIDLDTFELLEPSRDKISLLKFPFKSSILKDKTIDCPNWKHFLNEVLVTKETSNDEEPIPDQDLIDLIQEMFGYSLLSHNLLEKTFFLYGNGLNGKSKVIQTLKMLLPQQLVSCETLSRLTTNRFATASLVGKRINITSEEDSKYLASDIFKMMVSGEEISGERKFEGSFKFKPTLKFIFATNKIPTFDTIDEAIKRRLVIIPFFRKIPEHKKDIDLFERKLKPEMAGILKWAIEGAERITKNRKLTEPKAVLSMINLFEQTQSSAIEFFEENFEVTGNKKDILPRAKLLELYQFWVKEISGRHPLSKQNFYKDLEMKYRNRGVNFPENVIWDNKTNTPIRGIAGATPSNDPTAWINESGKWNAYLPQTMPNTKQVPF